MRISVDDAIRLAHVLFYNQNLVKIVLHMTRAIRRTNSLHSFLLFGFRVFAPGKLLPSPKMAVADPLTKTSAVWLVEFSCATVTKSLKEALVDLHGYSQQ